MLCSQHPLYRGQTTEHDLSVLVLERPVDLYTYPNIKPVSKQLEGEEMISNKTSFCSGVPS